MASPDSGGGIGIGTVLGVGGFVARVIGNTIFGRNPKDRGFYIKQYDAAGNTVSRTRVGVRAYNAAVAAGYRPGAQGGTVTPIRPPGSTPPPSPDVPPPAPGGMRGEAVRQGAVLGAWLIGQMGVDALRKAAAAKKAKEKADKKKAAAAKKKAEAEAKKRAAEEAKRREILSRVMTGRAPQTAGRGPITGPMSGNRMYDLPRNPATPSRAARTAMDVYIHNAPAAAATPTISAVEDVRLDPFIRTSENLEKQFPIKVALDYEPILRHAPRLPARKGALRTGRKVAKGGLAKAKAVYGKYLEVGAFATTLYTAFAPKTQPKNRVAKSSSSDPLTGVQPGLLALPQAALQPAYAYDRKGKCSCPKPKKKKRGPRKARTVCYKGSFTERAFGTSKRKREQVPCQA